MRGFAGLVLGLCCTAAVCATDGLQTPSLSIHADDGAFVAQGTMHLMGEDSAAPINGHRLMCMRDAGVCFHFWAFIAGDRLEIATATYNIVAWSDTKIAAINSDALCVDEMFTISPQDGRVVHVRRNKGVDLPACAILDKDDKVSILR